MQQAAQIIPECVSSQEGSEPIETTSYDLIEAVGEEVQPEEERLVPTIVLDLLNHGRSYVEY